MTRATAKDSGLEGRTTEQSALVGHLAPDFRLACTSASGPARQTITLDDYRGRWLVLMFYPRDFSLVCPTELSALSHRYDELFELGADVLAVSTDELDTHRRWLATPPAEGGIGAIRFPLGSDPDGSVTRSYYCCLDPQGIALRALFVIDPNGVVQYQLVHNLNVGRRTEEVLRVLTALQTGGLCGESWTPGRPVIDTRLLRAGAMVSHYRIERKLGDGGFASVYLAHDQTLGRDVALKLIRRTEGCSSPTAARSRSSTSVWPRTAARPSRAIPPPDPTGRRGPLRVPRATWRQSRRRAGQPPPPPTSSRSASSSTSC